MADPDPIFRLACVPAVLEGAPEGWAAALLAEGELALLAADAGLPAVNAVAHSLDLLSIRVLRAEETTERQEATVMAFAGSFPLVWIAPTFGDAARTWAEKRGPMTLLVEADGPLPDDGLRRIDRFVALLGRQAE